MGRSVATKSNRSGYTEEAASGDPEPWEVAADRERSDDDRPPILLVWGCGPWPIPAREDRTCGACGGGVQRNHYCLVCDRPQGSLVSRVTGRVQARNRRERAIEGDRLKGGTESRKAI